MQPRILAGIGAAFIASALSTTAIGQAPPPPPPSPTLWSFLGIPQAGYKINAQLFNRRGNHPGLEKKPPLKGIADPANLKSDVPAIKAAAEIKQAEDLAPQKIKAIKYLASIGCGCYDKDEKITKAILAAMDDCTEDVRLQAMYAVTEAAMSGRCEHCSQRNCCNEKITNQLYKIAYELDDLGCPVEPSERVREAAIEALQTCCPNRLPVEDLAPPAPVEGGERPAPIEGGDRPATGVPVPATPPTPALENRAAKIDPNHFLRDAGMSRSPSSFGLPSSRRTARMQGISQTVSDQSTSSSPLSPVGVVSLYDTRRNVAHVHFPNSEFRPEVGTRMQILVPSDNGPQIHGEVEVLESSSGSANVRPLGDLDVARIARQARIVVGAR